MERIPGGKARGGRCPRNVDKTELARGIKVELEHTTDRRVAREIACDHLTEDKRYYSKLATIHLDGGRRLGASKSAAMDEGRRKALLAKPVRFEGRQMTKAQMIEELVRRGGALKLDRLPKHVFSSRAYNKMGYAEQRAYDEKMKIKMPFAVQLPNGVFFEITQTEADYFKSLGGQLGASRARVLRGPAAPTFTVYVRNELIGTSRYVGTFASQAEAQAYVEAEARQARKFTTFEVWTGTPRAPRKPVAGATARGLHGASVGGRRRRVMTPTAPALPTLPTLPEAEHAEWMTMQAVTAALRSRDPAKIAQAKAALAAANEATFQAWGRLPAAERLRRREAGDVPPGV